MLVIRSQDSCYFYLESCSVSWSECYLLECIYLVKIHWTVTYDLYNFLNVFFYVNKSTYIGQKSIWADRRLPRDEIYKVRRVTEVWGIQKPHTYIPISLPTFLRTHSSFFYKALHKVRIMLKINFLLETGTAL